MGRQTVGDLVGGRFVGDGERWWQVVRGGRRWRVVRGGQRWEDFGVDVMCVLKSTRKRTNRLQYSVCKCDVESIGKWSNIGVLLNQPHFNLVPKV
jgi:hypothetical protein